MLALPQEAVLERENLKCCTYMGTTWRTETSLSGRWDNMPPVNTLKIFTHFPPFESEDAAISINKL